MTRRQAARAAVVAPIAAMAAAVAAPLRKQNVIRRSPPMVRQAELATVLDLYNRAEALAADIRRRLEAGADFERGELGVSTVGYGPLEYYEECGGDGHSARVELAGLDVSPVSWLTGDIELLRKCPGGDEFVLV